MDSRIEGFLSLVEEYKDILPGFRKKYYEEDELELLQEKHRVFFEGMPREVRNAIRIAIN